jgi:hypothetical protein
VSGGMDTSRGSDGPSILTVIGRGNSGLGQEAASRARTLNPAHVGDFAPPVAVWPAGAFSTSQRPARVLRTRGVAHQQGATRTDSAHASRARRCPHQRRRSAWLQSKSTQVRAGTSRLLPKPVPFNFVPFQFLRSTMPPQNPPGGHAAPAMPCVKHSKGLTCGRRGPHMPQAGNEGKCPPISELSNLRSWLTASARGMTWPGVNRRGAA